MLFSKQGARAREHWRVPQEYPGEVSVCKICANEHLIITYGEVCFVSMKTFHPSDSFGFSLMPASASSSVSRSSSSFSGFSGKPFSKSSAKWFSLLNYLWSKLLGFGKWLLGFVIPNHWLGFYHLIASCRLLASSRTRCSNAALKNWVNHTECMDDLGLRCSTHKPFISLIYSCLLFEG